MRHLEFEIQKAIFKWANLNLKKYPELELLNSSGNGLKLKNSLAGYRAKSAGMKRGYPDLFLPVARGNYHGLFIELKTKKNDSMNVRNGSLTKEQKEWLEKLNIQGYCAKVGYGLEETIEIIEAYLNL